MCVAGCDSVWMPVCVSIAVCDSVYMPVYVCLSVSVCACFFMYLSLSICDAESGDVERMPIPVCVSIAVCESMFRKSDGVRVYVCVIGCSAGWGSGCGLDNIER